MYWHKTPTNTGIFFKRVGDMDKSTDEAKVA
jgi:hypothetical protein